MQGTDWPGGVTILPGAKPTKEELAGANALAAAGYQVTIQPTANDQGVKNQQTADFNVPGLGQTDQYTPGAETSTDNIIRRIAEKNDQAESVLVQSNLSEDKQVEISNRLWGRADAKNINAVVFNSNGRITVFNRPK